MFALVNNNTVVRYPYAPETLKAENPNTSFPEFLTDETLASFNVIRVFFNTQPAYDQNTQRLVEGTPVFDTEAKRWTQTWTVQALSAEEIAGVTAAKARDVRSERNAKLAESDWTQLADFPGNKAAWATYRQALRDIPAQVGFPNSVNWPTKPE